MHQWNKKKEDAIHERGPLESVQRNKQTNMSRIASLLLPREESPKHLLLWENLVKLGPQKRGIGVVVEALAVSDAIRGDRRYKDVRDDVEVLDIAATELSDGLTLKPSRRDQKEIDRLHKRVRNFKVDERGTTLDDEFGEQAQSLMHLLQLFGEKRAEEWEACEASILDVRQSYSVSQVTLDISVRHILDAVGAIKDAETAYKAATKGLEVDAGMERAGALINEIQKDLATLLTSVTLTQNSATELRDVLGTELVAAARGQTRHADLSPSITEGVPGYDAWLRAFKHVVQVKTFNTVEADPDTFHDYGNFKTLAPKTLMDDDRKLNAINTLFTLAEQRALDRNASGWMTDDPDDVATMLLSIHAALSAMKKMAWRPSMGVMKTTKSIGATFNRVIKSAIAIEYRAAWEYFHNERHNKVIAHLYTALMHDRLLTTQDWASVMSEFQSGPWDDFREAVKRTYDP